MIRGQNGIYQKTGKNRPQYCKELQTYYSILVFIENTEKTGNFSRAQHASVKGMSMQTALTEIVKPIEVALCSRECLSKSLLNVKEAFAYADITSIINEYAVVLGDKFKERRRKARKVVTM